MLLFFSCQELVNNDQQRALTSRTPPRESSRSPTRAVSWVNRLFCSETDCTHLLPTDCPLSAVDEGGPDLPLRLPHAAPAGRLQPLPPLGLRSRLPLGALLRGQGQGVQPSVAPQAGEEIDPGRAACGQDQRPDHALQGVAAVENGQVLALDDAGLLAEQLDGQFALGPEFHDAVGPDWQLRLAEVEPAGDRQEPRGLLGFVEQGAQDDPVVGADGVLVEGTG